MSAVPVKILLVEDDASDVLLTRKAFERAKISNDMIVAENGVEALDILKKRGAHNAAERPDLVLLDLNMPVMDGFETLQAIRDDPDLETLPVIVMTTSDADEDVLKSYKLRANAYVKKPVGMDGFLEIINRIDGFWLQAVVLPPKN